ncbi:MAG TPA: PaaI family thioesterase [Candidatus Bathyarchaeia archaeon]|nr:PaaI family thioesterase [Candidatus Bathyarchaeia archaeon]
MSEGGSQGHGGTAGTLAGWFDDVMRFEHVAGSRDQVVIEYTISERHLQPYGIVHGGVHCAAIETACSTGAALDAMPRGQSVVGIENHTSFIHAVRGGRVRVTATPLTRGRRSQVWEASARDEQGRLVASGRVRLLCLDPGSLLAGEKVESWPSGK